MEGLPRVGQRSGLDLHPKPRLRPSPRPLSLEVTLVANPDLGTCTHEAPLQVVSAESVRDPHPFDVESTPGPCAA